MLKAKVHQLLIRNSDLLAHLNELVRGMEPPQLANPNNNGDSSMPMLNGTAMTAAAAASTPFFPVTATSAEFTQADLTGSERVVKEPVAVAPDDDVALDNELTEIMAGSNSVDPLASSSTTTTAKATATASLFPSETEFDRLAAEAAANSNDGP